MKRLGSLLPVLAAAAVLFGAFDAQASLERQLDRIVELAKAGKAEDVALTKRQVGLTMQLGETDVRIAYGVYGKQERKQVRYANLRLQLGGDRQAAFESLGWPTFRLLEDAAGVRTERWTYVDRKITYVFEANRLVRTETF